MTLERGAVPVVRGRTEIKSLASTIGLTRETRLTAMLGYLVSRAPEMFTELLTGRSWVVDRVRIEATDEDHRYDVVIEGASHRTIVEAKMGFLQRPQQIKTYLKRLRKVSRGRVDLVLLDRGSELLTTERRELQSTLPRGCQLIFRRWSEIADACRILERKPSFQADDPLAAGVAGDMAAHLEEEGMDRIAPKEVYVRQLRGSSLDLFFRHGIYKCQARFGPYASQHRYFAPLFTAAAPAEMREYSSVPIKAGLSWVALIRAGETVRYRDLSEFLRKHDVADGKRAEQLIRQRSRKRTRPKELSRKDEVFVLVLDRPFNLFTVPLSSKTLRVKGQLGQRSLTFAELFNLAETAR